MGGTGEIHSNDNINSFEKTEHGNIGIGLGNSTYGTVSKIGNITQLEEMGLIGELHASSEFDS